MNKTNKVKRKDKDRIERGLFAHHLDGDGAIGADESWFLGLGLSLRRASIRQATLHLTL